jgi:hypothetical protein
LGKGTGKISIEEIFWKRPTLPWKNKHRGNILEEAHASLSPGSWRRQIFTCYTERTKTKR